MLWRQHEDHRSYNHKSRCHWQRTISLENKVLLGSTNTSISWFECQNVQCTFMTLNMHQISNYSTSHVLLIPSWTKLYTLKQPTANPLQLCPQFSLSGLCLKLKLLGKTTWRCATVHLYLFISKDVCACVFLAVWQKGWQVCRQRLDRRLMRKLPQDTGFAHTSTKAPHTHMSGKGRTFFSAAKRPQPN